MDFNIFSLKWDSIMSLYTGLPPQNDLHTPCRLDFWLTHKLIDSIISIPKDKLSSKFKDAIHSHTVRHNFFPILFIA